MKTKLLILVVLLSTFAFRLSPCYAQVPQGFNYQAIARDGSGIALANQALPVRIAIQTSLTGGTLIYEELFSSVTSNQFGLISLVVGTGTQTGGSAASFSAIDWKAQTLFLKTTIQYPGTTWTTMGTSQIWAVPYSLVANDIVTKQTLSLTGTNLSISGGNSVSLVAGTNQWQTNGTNVYRATGNVGIGTTNPISKVVVQPDASWDDNTALFEVRNKIGVPVFAVYNNGIRILVDNTIGKGIKGGFSIGGYDQTKAGKTVDFMTISPDSVRFNINNSSSKGIKGGFAVGGYDESKKGAINQDFMYLTPQISNNGQYNTFLGYHAGLVNTGSYNVFVGYNSGSKNTTGYKNTFNGFLSGANNVSGHGNCYYGDSTGYTNSGGSYNTFIGNQAGRSSTSSENVFIGFTAGYSSANATRNVYIGARAGQSLTSSYENVIIGHQAAYNSTSGNDNVIIGRLAGYGVSGSNNVYLGYYSAGGTTTGQYNTCAGARSGYNMTGDYNVTIGYQAGSGSTGSRNIYIGYGIGLNKTETDVLTIDDGDSPSPLIWGDLSARRLVIRGRADKNVNNRTFFVNGTAGGTYAWYNDSDRDQKKNISTITSALLKVMQLRGVNYYWKDPSQGEEGCQMGFIGQEAAEIIPEVVNVVNNHYTMQYSPVTALLVEAIKEQQKSIENQKLENQQLKSELQILKDRMERMEAMMDAGGSK
jgi:hypothetical protein